MHEGGEDYRTKCLAIRNTLDATFKHLQTVKGGGGAFTGIS